MSILTARKLPRVSGRKEDEKLFLKNLVIILKKREDAVPCFLKLSFVDEDTLEKWKLTPLMVQSS